MDNEPWFVRLVVAPELPGSVSVFVRDRRCVITGEPVILDFWDVFEAAHIFPIAYEGHWKKFNYERCITIPPANASAGTINSVQNGMLLGA